MLQGLFLSTPSARRATHSLGFVSCRTSFLSTPSARRATAPQSSQMRVYAISIHALREEGDSRCDGRDGFVGNFYPRPPRGGRLEGVLGLHQGRGFLSTPSARRATLILSRAHSSRWNFYPRPPRGACKEQRRFCGRHFYPRPPRGGRPHRGQSVRPGIRISIHALREEGDR